MKTRTRFQALAIAVLAVVALLPFAGNSTPAHAVEQATVNPTPVYRFYKTTDGSHFFTNSANEKAQLQAIPNSGYRYEGIAYYAFPTQVAGTQPIYRFYKFAQGVHFFTINAQEAAGLQQNAANVYRYEGVAWYANASQVADSTPVYRFYKFKQGVHFYTANAGEAAVIQQTASSTYRYEGIAYYRPTKLHFSGTGDTTTGGVILPPGLVRFTTTTSSGPSGFTAASTNDSFLVSSRSTPGTVSYSAGIPAEAQYALSVTGGGTWSVTAEVLDTSVGLKTDWSGTSNVGTDLFTTVAGSKTFSYSYTGSVGQTFNAYLVDQQGQYLDTIADDDVPGSGTVAGSTTITTALQNYSIVVYAYDAAENDVDGTWSIHMAG